MEKLAELFNFGAVLFKLLQHYKLKNNEFSANSFFRKG